MVLIVTVLVVFAVLVAAELLWRRTGLHNEFSRKIIHITVGSFVAFWPFFLNKAAIIGLSIAFLLVVAVSRWLNVFQAIHNVQRPTWGEVFFAVAVGAVALISNDKWVYMAALLQMSLADGFAAVAGVSWGKTTTYKIAGQKKSLVGTAVFGVISVSILVVFSFASGHILPFWQVAAIAAIASLMENVGVHGLDNLLVPLFVSAALTLLV